jgi:Domain of unknown function (DUF4326)
VPVRIQQRRLKGWRKPPGAVSVARPGRWGNPFPVEHGDHATAVARFSEYLATQPELVAAARQALRGKDLMCFCPPSEPCHADVWLHVVNAGDTDP